MEAVAKARAVRNEPLLATAAPLEAEINAFIPHKLARNEWSADSAASKQHCLRLFAEHTGKHHPEAITRTDCQRFYDSYEGKGVNSTREQVESLVANAPDDAMQFILFCGFHAGMRKREITEARPEWFDLQRGKLTIEATETFRPKDREARSVPLTKAFAAFLNSYGLHSPFLLHPAVRHRTWRYRYDFRKPFDTYVRAQDCGNVTPTSFASLHAIAGTSIFKISEWLGDDVRVVQRHYAKLAPDDVDIEKAFNHTAVSETKD